MPLEKQCNPQLTKEQLEEVEKLLRCRQDRFKSTYMKDYVNPWISDRIAAQEFIVGDKLPFETVVPGKLPGYQYRPSIPKTTFTKAMSIGCGPTKGFVYEALKVDPKHLEWKTTYATTIGKTGAIIMNKKILRKRQLKRYCV